LYSIEQKSAIQKCTTANLQVATGQNGLQGGENDEVYRRTLQSKNIPDLCHELKEMNEWVA
jgi:hypothetical protein